MAVPAWLAYFRIGWSNVAELLIMAAAWVLLERGIPRSLSDALRWLRDELLLAVLFYIGSNLPHLWNGWFYIVSWDLLRAAITLAYARLARGKLTKYRFALWCFMFSGVLCLEGLGGQLMHFLAYFYIPHWVAYLLLLTRVMESALALWLRYVRFSEEEDIPAGCLYMVLIVPIAVLLFRVLESFWAWGGMSTFLCFTVAYLCILIMVAVSVLSVARVCREHGQVVELGMAKQRLQSEKAMLQLTKQQLEELREVRHEARNQFSYMRILLDQKRYDEMEDYFDRFSDAMADTIQTIDCGNQSISVILNMERSKAHAAGTDFQWELTVPKELPFSDDDMCSLLANLIDNAIEECIRIAPTSGQTPPTFRLSMHPQKDYLYIEVRNPTRRSDLQRGERGLLTTKGDTPRHGYGTRIVERLAEKYNGCASFRIEAGEFIAQVMVDMLYEKE